MLKIHHRNKSAGFTLIEILAAILLLTFFLSVTMQAMVIAAMFKVKAKRYSVATAWIQEDLESVRNQASVLSQSLMSVSLSVAVGTPSTTVIIVDNIGTLAVNDKILIGDAGKIFTITSITGTTITLNSYIGKTLVVGSKVIETTLCSATATTNGFANALNNSLIPISTANSKKSLASTTDQKYQITRTTTLKNASPYNVLEVLYKVTPENKTTPVIATSFSEVIPDVSFYCP
ncbi:MAG: prepilin-type N-terminal cleavage/methylation domain-containing protein [Crinalium sp.]